MKLSFLSLKLNFVLSLFKMDMEKSGSVPFDLKRFNLWKQIKKAVLVRVHVRTASLHCVYSAAIGLAASAMLSMAHSSIPRRILK